MCDIKKFHKIYEDILTLHSEDALMLMLEAETEDEKAFYELVRDFLKQKERKDGNFNRLTKQKRLEYEAREKAIRDHNQMMYEAEERGRLKGIEESQKFEREVAKKLLAMEYPIAIIAQGTGLSEEEVKKIQEEI